MRPSCKCHRKQNYNGGLAPGTPVVHLDGWAGTVIFTMPGVNDGRVGVLDSVRRQHLVDPADLI